MIILGVSALYHDSAAALVVDGEIVAAAQEERFSRIKHDASIPVKAIEYCLREAGVKAEDLDVVVFYDNPILSLDRFMYNVRECGTDAGDLLRNNWEKTFSYRLWIHELLKEHIPMLGETIKFFVTKHHIAHASAAFFPSPFQKSVILTIDGVGEWATLSIGIGDGNKIVQKEEMRYPHSLGLFYSAFTYFCGFKVNEGDYKFMGLAPYGEPIYYDLIRDNIIHIFSDGSFYLNMDYFDYQNGRTMINEDKMRGLFGGQGRRIPESVITQREMDIAASVQKITEEVLFLIVRHAKEKYGGDSDNLVMAGGVALNCVANGKILKEKIFEHVWIQPAAGDAGSALGAALYYWYQVMDKPRIVDGNKDKQKGSYLGPEYTEGEILEFLQKKQIRFQRLNDDELSVRVAELLNMQKIIGLFWGRMEFGPRALGHRSIIADPRCEDMQVYLNLKIKYRESFRPFAPSVLKEDVADYFELNEASPYMLICADVKRERRKKFDKAAMIREYATDMLPIIRKSRSDIPAVTHIDYSARIQTVDGEYNPFYYNIIKEFKRMTGCSVIVNTSFNLRGEPIVCTPQDAYICFMRSGMDVLILGNYLLLKEEQEPLNEEKDWRNQYELD